MYKTTHWQQIWSEALNWVLYLTIVQYKLWQVVSYKNLYCFLILVNKIIIFFSSIILKRPFKVYLILTISFFMLTVREWRLKRNCVQDDSLTTENGIWWAIKRLHKLRKNCLSTCVGAINRINKFQNKKTEIYGSYFWLYTIQLKRKQ